MKDKVERTLHAVLYRYECPPALALSDYQMQILSKTDQGEIAAHVAQCPHCRAELQRLAAFLAPDTALLGWREAGGFIWQRFQEKGAILIRILQEALLPLPPHPLAVKGHKPEVSDLEIIRRITLSPDETGDLDIEAIIWRDPQSSTYCQMSIRVQSPYRWPELAGVVVQAVAHTWQREGTTNDNGEVTFGGLPEEWSGELSIEVRP
jgi:hypothetical protein